jgi:hypothetical protein
MFVRFENSDDETELVVGPFDFVEVDGANLIGCKRVDGMTVVIDSDIASLEDGLWNMPDGRWWTSYLITPT